MTEVASEGISQSPEVVFLSRGRLYLIGGAFATELVLFFGGLTAPLDQGTRELLVNQTSGPFGQISSAAPPQAILLIFSHNALIALVEMVPLLGALVFGYTLYTTGLVAQAILTSQGVPPLFGLILFVLPYSFVELSAYAVALASGIMIPYQLLRHRLMGEAKVLVVEGGVVLALLVIAAVMEEATSINPGFGFALWVPTGLGIAGTMVFLRKKLR